MLDYKGECESDTQLNQRLIETLQQSADERRRFIRSSLSQGAMGDREISVGIKAFDRLCDIWGLSSADARRLLHGNDFGDKLSDRALLLERISYLLRIFRLMSDVVQGDDERQQRWLRRAMPAFDGKRPIDLMMYEPYGLAIVMERLDHWQQGTW